VLALIVAVAKVHNPEGTMSWMKTHSLDRYLSANEAQLVAQDDPSHGRACRLRHGYWSDTERCSARKATAISLSLTISLSLISVRPVCVALHLGPFMTRNFGF
jgi:hypothetical protein